MRQVDSKNQIFHPLSVLLLAAGGTHSLLVPGHGAVGGEDGRGGDGVDALHQPRLGVWGVWRGGVSGEG